MPIFSTILGFSILRFICPFYERRCERFERGFSRDALHAYELECGVKLHVSLKLFNERTSRTGPACPD